MKRGGGKCSRKGRETVEQLDVFRFMLSEKTKMEVVDVEKCTFCGSEEVCKTKIVGGYTILESCVDCEEEILN